MLLVLQGTDTSGKDGVVSHVVGQVGPAGLRITSFKRRRPRRRRTTSCGAFVGHCRRPGIIGVFNRSHYEDVLVTRVHQRIDDDAWAGRIADINAFERELAESGTVLIKCFLHTSYAPSSASGYWPGWTTPPKYWKFNPADMDDEAYWSDYQAAYAAAIAATSTEWRPGTWFPATPSGIATGRSASCCATPCWS